MIEEYKDYCVLKAYDLSQKEIDKCKSLVCTNGVFIEIDQTCFDASIVLINKNESEVVFNNLLSKILDLLKNKIYADYDTTLEACVVEKAKEKNILISVAESLTGGMVCSSLVNVPGSSSVLYEGFVTYSSMSKVRRLHVKSATLDQYGAISEQTCKEMVQGLLENKEIRLALATTGCAGPTSDEFDTPIGRVYVGIGSNLGIVVKQFDIEGNRNYIRKSINNAALYMLLNYIEKLD